MEELLQQGSHCHRELLTCELGVVESDVAKSVNIPLGSLLSVWPLKHLITKDLLSYSCELPSFPSLPPSP